MRDTERSQRRATHNDRINQAVNDLIADIDKVADYPTRTTADLVRQAELRARAETTLHPQQLIGGASERERSDAIALLEDPYDAQISPALARRHGVDADSLGAFLHRHDTELRRAAVAMEQVYRIEAAELFRSARVQFWLHRDELIGVGEADRLPILLLMLARRSRELARRGDLRRDFEARRALRTPTEDAAMAAVAAHAPAWRPIDPAVLVARETTVFRAMARLTAGVRDVLVLRYLNITLDDIADELRISTRSVEGLLGEARVRIRGLLATTEANPPARTPAHCAEVS